MRLSTLVVLAACGGAAPAPTTPAKPAPPPTSGTTARKPAAPDRAPVDLLAALAPVDDAPVSWVVPGKIQLELGGSVLDPPGGNRELEVVVIDRQGSRVRVGVRLPHVRFAVWTDASRMLAVLARAQQVHAVIGGGPGTRPFVSLLPGARVRKLAHEGTRTRVRYVGSLEVEGWVADEALAEAGPAGGYRGRVPTGRKTLMVMPGAVIRTEARWAGTELAKLTGSGFLDTVKELDAEWVEVAYRDGDVQVHGFVSRRGPPGRVHRTKDPEVPPPTVTANARVASGTCLYARAGGEPVGYLVGDREVHLEDAGGGWWTISVDTTWGALPFAAKGPAATSLEACAPAGSVPASTLAPAPAPSAP